MSSPWHADDAMTIWEMLSGLPKVGISHPQQPIDAIERERPDVFCWRFVFDGFPL